MAHYFDDVFSRQVIPRSPSMPRIRRSSTARSIGARSDFDQSEANGYDDDHDGHSISGSVILTDDPQRIREKEEADEHMHNYIAEQLERVKSEQLSNGYEKGDELEAQH